MADVVVHRSRVLEPRDLVVRNDGIVVTNPHRTIFDLAACLPSDDLESMIEQGLERQLLTVPSLWATARRLARQGRAGSGRFVQVLGDREPWRRPVQSDLELRLERALRRAGVPCPVRQYPVEVGRGVVVHLDLAWPDRRIGIEVDHVTWHGGRLDATADKWRDRQLSGLGWTILRVDDSDLRGRMDSVVDDIDRVLRLARAS